MLMSPEELTARLRREIDRRGTADRLIDLDEERELLQIALAFGFEAAKGRAVLAEVCAERGYIRERAVREAVREELVKLGGRPLRKIEFVRLVTTATTTLVDTVRTTREIRRLVAEEVADSGVPVRSRWPFDWWRRISGERGV